MCPAPEEALAHATVAQGQDTIRSSAALGIVLTLNPTTVRAIARLSISEG
jgi:hypothetical protein